VLEEKCIAGYLILHVKYPNCTNYEGRKLMVFKGYRNLGELMRDTGGKLDPHFSHHKWSPIARFKPEPDNFRLVEEVCRSRGGWQ